MLSILGSICGKSPSLSRYYLFACTKLHPRQSLHRTPCMRVHSTIDLAASSTILDSRDVTTALINKCNTQHLLEVYLKQQLSHFQSSKMKQVHESRAINSNSAQTCSQQLDSTINRVHTCSFGLSDVKSLLVCDACERTTHLKCLQMFLRMEILPS